MEYPITVERVDFRDTWPIKATRLSGSFVAVRVCEEMDANVTRLGVIVGEIALVVGVDFATETGTLFVSRGMFNPAIWVPDLKRIVMGCESWWDVIDSPEKLRQITDAEINSLWYVQALKSFTPEATVDGHSEAHDDA